MLYIHAHSLDESLSFFSLPFPFTPSGVFATSKGKKVEYSRSFDKQTRSTPKKGPLSSDVFRAEPSSISKERKCLLSSGRKVGN